jgi:hypothetical protein
MGAPFYGSRIACTTVAIAPDQALTAADCLFEEASGRRMQPQSLHVLWDVLATNIRLMPSFKAIISTLAMIMNALTTHWTRIGLY